MTGHATEPVLVVGVGNRYRGDDGAGLAAAARLGEAAGAPVVLLDNAGDGTVLLDVWQRADAVILIDAMRSGAPAGTVRRLDAAAEVGAANVAALLSQGRTLGGSTHGVGVAEAVALGRTLHRLPRRLVVIGIEGRRFDAGVDLSHEVERALDEAVRLGLEEVADVHRAAR
ncbi:MAG TPA: hydrogenase maturation protease [bacterium]|nr:hydrogenase maturation protease [bacterium]